MKKKILFSVIITLVTSGFAVEWYARVISRGFEIIHGYEYRPDKLGMLKPKTYLKLPRNFSASPMSYSAHVNPWGLRGELPPDFMDDRYERIYMTGDSTMFGVGVGDNETVPCFVQNGLCRELNPDILTLNAGVPGFSPLDHELVIARYASKARPRLIVEGIFDNDLYDITVEPDPRINDVGWTRTAKNLTIDMYNSGILKSPGLMYLYYMGFKRHKLNRHVSYEDAGVKLGKALESIRDISTALKSDLLVVYIPRPTGKVNPELASRIDPICRKLGISLLDIRKDILFKEGFSFPDDGHYTAEGNRMIGNIIAGCIIRDREMSVAVHKE